MNRKFSASPVFCLGAFCLGALFFAACTGLDSSMGYHQSEEIISLLNTNHNLLNHTPPGSYSFSATSPTVSTVDLSVAGVTNREDQNALLGLLKDHHFDRTRDWNEIKVFFYETTIPAPETSQGFRYVNLLRTESVN